MATKHTPGPWRVVLQSQSDFVNRPGNRIGPAICSVEKAFTTIPIHAEPTDEKCPDVDTWNATSEANALLICAAPELLETLEKLIAFMEKNGLSKTPSGGFGPLAYEGTEYEEVTKAKQAIEKATAKKA